MVNLMMAFKNYSLFLGIYFIPNYSDTNVSASKDSFCYEIRFGDNFSNDTIDFFINDVIVLKKAVLKSNMSYGLTTSWVNIIQDEKSFFVVSSQNQIKKYIDTGGVRLKLAFNKKILYFNVDRGKGRFITISKGFDDDIVFAQNQKQPIYD